MIALAWLLAVVAVVALCWWIIRTFVDARPAAIAGALKLFTASFVLMASMGILTLGRVGLFVALLGAVGLTVVRLRARQRPPDPIEGEASGSSGESTIETGWLAMRLDRASGEIDGRVLRGRFCGQGLASLTLNELFSLRRDLQQEEPASLPLLDTWLDRTRPDWRNQQGNRKTGSDGAAPAGIMDEAAALDILGLSAGATRAEIEAAYRRVMAKVHPDRGGSDRLASLVNAARDQLLRRS